MKKIFKYLLLLLVAIILPSNVFAKGSVTTSTTNLTITKGSTASFTITANNAAGRLDLSSSNSNVASISDSKVWVDNQSVTIKVTGKSVGTSKIVIKKTDVATYDSEVLSGTITINVKVVEKKVIINPLPSNPTTPSTPSTPVEVKKSAAYDIALIGVKKVEESLLRSDYDTVLEMVNALEDEDEKKELLERLNDTVPNLKTTIDKVVECEVCEKCVKTDNLVWNIISIILLLMLIAESIYLIVKKRKQV